MAKYVLSVTARWVDAFESPLCRGDESTDNTKEGLFIFESTNREEAKAIARQKFSSFWDQLPKKHQGSLAWQTEEPSITINYFAEILEFSPNWEEALVQS